MAAWQCRGAVPGAMQADPSLPDDACLASKDPEGTPSGWEHANA